MFVRNTSIHINLITFVEFVTECFENDGQIKVIYTDFVEAFDKVKHDILLGKLFTFRLSSNLFCLFTSFLESRSRYVQLNNKILTSFGILQGSNLGPLFS